MDGLITESNTFCFPPGKTQFGLLNRHIHTLGVSTPALLNLHLFLCQTLDFYKSKERWKYLAALWCSKGTHKIYTQSQRYSTWSSSMIRIWDTSRYQNDWYQMQFEFIQFLQSWTFLGAPLCRNHQMIFLFWTHYTCQWKQGCAYEPVKMWVTPSSRQTQNRSSVVCIHTCTQTTQSPNPHFRNRNSSRGTN